MTSHDHTNPLMRLLLGMAMVRRHTVKAKLPFYTTILLMMVMKLLTPATSHFQGTSIYLCASWNGRTL